MGASVEGLVSSNHLNLVMPRSPFQSLSEPAKKKHSGTLKCGMPRCRLSWRRSGSLFFLFHQRPWHQW